MLSLLPTPITMGLLAPEDALYGAAYQILFATVDPDACISKERLDFVNNYCARCLAWAEIQAPDVKRAYQRATVDIKTRATTQYWNVIRSLQMEGPDQVGAATPQAGIS